MNWWAQTLGLLICLISGGSYLLRRKDRYLLAQIAANLLFCAQYLLLGAYSGVVGNVISLAKYSVFYTNARRDRKNPRWHLWLFCGLSVVLGVWVLDGWHTYIPMVVAVIFTFAVWQDNPIVLRGIAVVCNALWVVFNLVVGAYVSAVYSGVELVIALVTMIRQWREPPPEA